MEDVSDKLKALLSDPAGMEKIMGVAKALGAGEKKDPPEARASPAPAGEGLGRLLEDPELKRLFCDEAAKRDGLLRAIMPYLSAPRREKLSRILKATSAVAAVYSARGLL